MKAFTFYQKKIANWQSDVTEFTDENVEDLTHDLNVLQKRVNDGVFHSTTMGLTHNTHQRLSFFNATDHVAMQGMLMTNTIAPGAQTLVLK